LRITAGRVDDQEGPVTELFGKVRDQAALAGVLNSLYELHLTLLSVEYLTVISDIILDFRIWILELRNSVYFKLIERSDSTNPKSAIRNLKWNNPEPRTLNHLTYFNKRRFIMANATKTMKKILVLAASILLLCSYDLFAGMNCTTKYQNFRDRLSDHEITNEQKTQVYERLFDAEKLCNEGKTEEEEKVLKDAAGMVALDEVFSDPE